MNRSLAGCVYLLLLCGCGDDRPVPIPSGAALVEDPALSELSGLSASASQNVLWAINDSGNLGRLFRLGQAGQSLGRVDVDGAWWWDTEALAHWQEGEQSWLLIGDIGDNRAWRRSVVIHAVPEPGLQDESVDIAWSLRFAYPEGPRDAEAMAVDPRDASVLVLTKDPPQALYRIKLSDRDRPATVLAERLLLMPEQLFERPVTDLAIDAAGERLTALTYERMYHWQRQPGQDWPVALAEAPQTLRLPVMRKAEALTLINGSELVIGSEHRPTPLWRAPKPESARASPP